MKRLWLVAGLLALGGCGKVAENLEGTVRGTVIKEFTLNNGTKCVYVRSSEGSVGVSCNWQ